MKTNTPFYTRLAHIVTCILGIGYLAILGKAVLAPLILALLFAMMLVPLANFFEKRLRLGRAFSSLAVLILLVGCVWGIIVLFAGQLGAFAKDLPAFESQLAQSLERMQDWVAANFNITNKEQHDYVANTAHNAVGQGTMFVGLTILSLSTSLLFMVFTFLYTFFLLLHRRLLLRFVVSLFHKEHSSLVFDAITHIRFIIRRYIVGLILQMAIVTALAFMALSVIGVKYAFLLALFTGVLNVIPYLGILSSLLLSVLVTFATADARHVLFVAIAIVAIHLTDSNFIMPKIVGSKVKLNTLSALLALVIGELVWGITGMFLAIPVLAILKVVFDRVDGMKPWGMVLGEDEGVPEETIEV